MILSVWLEVFLVPVVLVANGVGSGEISLVPVVLAAGVAGSGISLVAVILDVALVTACG